MHSYIQVDSRQASTQAGMQACRQAGMQACTQAGMQAGRQACRHADRDTVRQTGTSQACRHAGICICICVSVVILAQGLLLVAVSDHASHVCVQPAGSACRPAIHAWRRADKSLVGPQTYKSLVGPDKSPDKLDPVHTYSCTRRRSIDRLSCS